MPKQERTPWSLFYYLPAAATFGSCGHKCDLAPPMTSTLLHTLTHTQKCTLFFSPLPRSPCNLPCISLGAVKCWIACVTICLHLCKPGIFSSNSAGEIFVDFQSRACYHHGPAEGQRQSGADVWQEPERPGQVATWFKKKVFTVHHTKLQHTSCPTFLHFDGP